MQTRIERQPDRSPILSRSLSWLLNAIEHPDLDSANEFVFKRAIDDLLIIVHEA